MMAKSRDSKRNKRPKAPSTLKLYRRLKKLEERELDRPIKQGGGINLADRIIHSICEAEYRTKKKNGKMVFDCKEAIRKDPLVWKFYKGRPEDLANRLYQISKTLEKHGDDYIKTAEGSMSPWRYRDLFGNIEIFNGLCDEIRILIEAGEVPKKHSRRLERKYHQGRWTLDDLWKEISEGRL